MPGGNLENETGRLVDAGARLRTLRKRLHASGGRRADVARWVADADKGSEEFRLTPPDARRAAAQDQLGPTRRSKKRHDLALNDIP